MSSRSSWRSTSRRSQQRSESPDAISTRATLGYEIPPELQVDPDEPDWDDNVPDYTKISGVTSYHPISTEKRRQLDGLGIGALCSPTAAYACTALGESPYSYYDYPAKDLEMRRYRPEAACGQRGLQQRRSHSHRHEKGKEPPESPPRFISVPSNRSMDEMGAPPSLFHSPEYFQEDERREARARKQREQSLSAHESSGTRRHTVPDGATEHRFSDDSTSSTNRSHRGGSRNRSWRRERFDSLSHDEGHTTGCTPFRLSGLLTPRSATPTTELGKTSPKSIIENCSDVLARIQSKRELHQLRDELAILKRWTSDDVSTADTSNRRRTVRFSHPLVTSLQYRPKTRPEECAYLYFDEKELQTLEEDRENRVAEEEVECIATTQQEELYVSVAFPRRLRAPSSLPVRSRGRHDSPKERVGVEI